MFFQKCHQIHVLPQGVTAKRYAESIKEGPRAQFHAKSKVSPPGTYEAEKKSVRVIFRAEFI